VKKLFLALIGVLKGSATIDAKDIDLLQTLGKDLAALSKHAGLSSLSM